MPAIRPLLFRSPVLFFCSILAFLAGCGWWKSQGSLETREGVPLEIRLPANFSTGYRWVLDPPLQAAHVLAENYQPNTSGRLAGSPGTQVFRVVFPRDGRFNLKFSYRRLWESSSVPPAQTTNLVVRVHPAKGDPSRMERFFTKDVAPESNIPQPEDEEPQATTRKVELKRPR